MLEGSKRFAGGDVPHLRRPIAASGSRSQDPAVRTERQIGNASPVGVMGILGLRACRRRDRGARASCSSRPRPQSGRWGYKPLTPSNQSPLEQHGRRSPGNVPLGAQSSRCHSASRLFPSGLKAERKTERRQRACPAWRASLPAGVAQVFTFFKWSKLTRVSPSRLNCTELIAPWCPLSVALLIAHATSHRVSGSVGPAADQGSTIVAVPLHHGTTGVLS